MRCVSCSGDTRVTTTYQNAVNTVRRRRECLECGIRFTTREAQMEVVDEVDRVDSGQMDLFSETNGGIRHEEASARGSN